MGTELQHVHRKQTPDKVLIYFFLRTWKTCIEIMVLVSLIFFDIRFLSVQSSPQPSPLFHSFPDPSPTLPRATS